MMWRLILVFFLAACSAYPAVHWPEGRVPAVPVLLPASDLLPGPPAVAEARGAALAAEAAALTLRAAQIGTD